MEPRFAEATCPSTMSNVVELLAACCERVSEEKQRRLADACCALWSTGPASLEDILSHASHSLAKPPPNVKAEPASPQGELPGAASPNWYACRTGPRPPLTEGLLRKSAEGLLSGTVSPNWSACQTGSRQAPPTESPPREPACTGPGCTLARAALEVDRPSDHEEVHDSPGCSPAPRTDLTPSPAIRMRCTVRGRMHGS
jgi:hypothetical protein